MVFLFFSLSLSLLPQTSGKTSFFRLLAGLWKSPQREGSTLHLPSPHDLFLVPQTTYCGEGTLADLITYPLHLTQRTKEEESRLLCCLESVGVCYLVSRNEKGLDAYSDRWNFTLSLGEQQRIQLGRVLWHRPMYAVLDEATDAVSQEAELELYACLHSAEVTAITISKRLSLPQYHTQQLCIDLSTFQPNGWQLVRLGPNYCDQEE
jgi:ABC-type uncharacterized transport system fused permease/ATPase subunit